MKYLLLLALSLLLTFQLSAQNQDCVTALNLLTKDSITVEEINGSGAVDDAFDNDCLFGDAPFESQSSWYTFTAFTAGNFFFTIKPINPTDDLDFYLLKATAQTCESAVSVRCNASSCVGENGYTGMSPDDEDLFEDVNCEADENRFTKDVELNKGDVYYLLVNNFTGNAGYTIVFCGSALFSEDDNVCTQDVSSLDIYTEKNYTISPNPARDYISISDFQDIDKLGIYSTQGTLVKSSSVVSEKMELDLIPGMYYCKLYTKEGLVSIIPFVQL